ADIHHAETRWPPPSARNRSTSVTPFSALQRLSIRNNPAPGARRAHRVIQGESRLLALTTRVAALLLALAPLGAAAAAPDRTVLPPPTQPFQGKISRTVEQSRAAFAPRLAAPTGAPNIVVILTDDVGFAATTTFGGPVETPALDQL